MPTTHTAAEIIDAAQQHIATLVARKWPEISRILEKDEEIKIAASIVVTAREPEVGEHADKDNRVKTTISFAEKFSDSTETALDDPDQGELPLGETNSGGSVPQPEEEELHEAFDTVPPQSADVPPPGGYWLVTEGESEEGDMAWNEEAQSWEPCTTFPTSASGYKGLARKSAPIFSEETLQREDATAGMTPLGQAIHVAAAGKPTPLVNVQLSADYTADKARAMFRKAAKKQGWPEAAIDLLDEACKAAQAQAEGDETAAVAGVLAILNAHTVTTAE